MLGKEKRNREVQQDVAGKMNLSKDDIFKNLIIEYASSRMDLIIKLRQKRITDEEFMAYVDESLKKIDADTEVIDQARLMFYQYVFRYFRLTPLMEDPEISDIHCIAYNKIRIKKRGKRQGQMCSLHPTRNTGNLLTVWRRKMVLISQTLMLFRDLLMMKLTRTLYCDLR